MDARSAGLDFLEERPRRTDHQIVEIQSEQVSVPGDELRRCTAGERDEVVVVGIAPDRGRIGGVGTPTSSIRSSCC